MYPLRRYSKQLILGAVPVVFALKIAYAYNTKSDDAPKPTLVLTRKYSYFIDTNEVKFHLSSIQKRCNFITSCDFSNDTSSNKTIKYPNGDTYIGETESDLRHGHGVMRYVDGRVYDGEWKDDKRHGKGVYTSPDDVLYFFLLNPENTKYIVSSSSETGILADLKKSVLKKALGLNIHNALFGIQCVKFDETYTGQFENDRFHGYGVLTRSSDGSILYDGHWHSNEPHGSAKYIKTNGGAFSGDVYFGQADGHGTAAVPEGVYSGQLKNGQAEGNGTMTFTNGDVYSGEFSGGKINGTGVIQIHDGDKSYEGEWKDGTRHGQGVLRVGDRVVYTGNWVNDRMFGQGNIYSAEDNSVFTGEIGANGPLAGQIVVILRDGSQYSLNAHPDAVPLFTEYAVYFGAFNSERKFTGCAIMSLENGGVYAGDIVNDEANGHGVMKYADGTVFEGEWKNDNMHGRGVLRGSDGEVMHDGLWEHDQPVVIQSQQL